jgi:hypothetical protein
VSLDLNLLHRFAITAKRACYIGGGDPTEASRTGSHDLAYAESDWLYRDSYFGGTDFVGQEVIWYCHVPVWAMNYYGYILRPDLITSMQAGETLKAALSHPDSQARLLDNFEVEGLHGHFCITSQGAVDHFSGRESISVSGITAYALDYHGGLIRP